MKTAKQIAEKTRERQKKQNEYIKQNFDRVSVVMKKGRKELINNTGENVNSFICAAIDRELIRRGLLDDPGREPAD